MTTRGFMQHLTHVGLNGEGPSPLPSARLVTTVAEHGSLKYKQQEKSIWRKLQGSVEYFL